MTTPARPQCRRLGVMDWLVVVMVVGGVCVPLLAVTLGLSNEIVVIRIFDGLGIVAIVLMISWMLFGQGARSQLWEWLPPFWPWGRVVCKTPFSRWVLVALLMIGTALGVFGSKMGI